MLYNQVAEKPVFKNRLKNRLAVLNTVLATSSLILAISVGRPLIARG